MLKIALAVCIKCTKDAKSPQRVCGLLVSRPKRGQSGSTMRQRSALENGPAGIGRFNAEFFLDTDELVVLGQPVGA